MKHHLPELTIHQATASLDKPPSSFTRDDLVDFIKNEHICHVNFMYPADDGRLKTLNFVLHDKDHLEDILTCGERMDGSSLFASMPLESSSTYTLQKAAQIFKKEHREDWNLKPWESWSITELEKIQGTFLPVINSAITRVLPLPSLPTFVSSACNTLPK